MASTVGSSVLTGPAAWSRFACTGGVALASTGLRISYRFGVPILRMSYGYAGEDPRTLAKRPTPIPVFSGVFACVCWLSQNTNQSGQTVRVGLHIGDSGFRVPFTSLRPPHAGLLARQDHLYAILGTPTPALITRTPTNGNAEMEPRCRARHISRFSDSRISRRAWSDAIYLPGRPVTNEQRSIGGKRERQWVLEAR